MTENKLYTIKEVAEILKLAPNTVKLYCRRQQLGFIIVGRFYRISQEHLDEYYRANTIPMKNTPHNEG